MKIFLSFLTAIVFIHGSNAFLGLQKNGFWNKTKYHSSRLSPHDDITRISNDEVVVTKLITQRLNNFDPQDNRRWLMRYMENRNFWELGGPICIAIGGEWRIFEEWLLTGHMHDMCRDLKGIMFHTEHRYYGDSWPTIDLSVENLKYLSIDQALADLAHFISHIKETNTELENSGVFLFGASYSATMATWFLQKYPHLAVGAWASSAPLLAKVDFFEFNEVVSQAMESIGGRNCSDRITRAFKQLENLIEEGNSKQIEEMFKLCYPLDLSNKMDVGLLFYNVAEGFSSTVKTHREHSRDIERECDVLLENVIEDDLEALSYWFWDGTPGGDICYDHRYDNLVSIFRSTDWNDWTALIPLRQWFYQTCSEYGWYSSSASDNILFGSSFPVELYTRLCQDVYGDLFTAERIQNNVERTNIIYGALNPSVRNVYSTHGEFDPWRPMGVQTDINDYSPTVILPRQTHFSDIFSVSELDTPELLESKQRIFNLLRQWFGIEENKTTPTL